MENSEKEKELKSISMYMEEKSHVGSVVSQTKWFTDKHYTKDIEVEAHETMGANGEVEEVYVEISINKDGEQLASIILSPREAYQLGGTLEDFGRQLSVKHLAFLQAEERSIEEYLTKEKAQLKPQVTE